MKAGLRNKGVDARYLKAEDKSFRESSTKPVESILGNVRERTNRPIRTTKRMPANPFAIGRRAQPQRQAAWGAAKERAESFRAESQQLPDIYK